MKNICLTLFVVNVFLLLVNAAYLAVGDYPFASLIGCLFGLFGSLVGWFNYQEFKD